MKSPMNKSWLRQALIMWLLMGASGVSFLALILLAWHYQSLAIAAATVIGFGSLMAFFLYGLQLTDD